jgi:hypothetical protein
MSNATLMTYRLITTLLFVLFFGNYVQGQDINVVLSKLFFNVDVTELDKSLLDKFSKDTTLRKSEERMDTVFYPLKNKDAKYLLQHNFSFKKNSYLKTQIVDGNLGVIIAYDQSNREFTVLFLALEFKNVSELGLAYDEILGTLKNLGVLEIKSEVPKAVNIMNLEYQKKIEIFQSPFPSIQSDHSVLYIYIKKLKK